MGPIFNGHRLGLQPMTIEDGTHSDSQSVLKKFTLYTVQNPENQKFVCFVFNGLCDQVLAHSGVLTGVRVSECDLITSKNDVK